jgi:hypothetical protein
MVKQELLPGELILLGMIKEITQLREIIPGRNSEIKERMKHIGHSNCDGYSMCHPDSPSRNTLCSSYQEHC